MAAAGGTLPASMDAAESPVVDGRWRVMVAGCSCWSLFEGTAGSADAEVMAAKAEGVRASARTALAVIDGADSDSEGVSSPMEDDATSEMETVSPDVG